LIIGLIIPLKDQMILYKDIANLQLIVKTIKTTMLSVFSKESDFEKLRTKIVNFMSSTYTDSWMNQVFTKKDEKQIKSNKNKKNKDKESIALLKTLVKKNLDQAIYGLVLGVPIIVVGNDPDVIRLVMNTLTIFTPHRDLSIFQDIGLLPQNNEQDYDLIGTFPNYMPKNKKNFIIVNLEKSKVYGGKRNTYCEQLIDELAEAEKKSDKLLKILANRRINWLFTSAASITQVEDSEKQKQAINNLIKKMDRDSIYLIAKILEENNKLLYKHLLSRFSIKARLFKSIF
ncbi:MAG: hypothetical protein ACFFD1_11825, partial [Candidatus Thorarchaeota archaeon]